MRTIHHPRYGYGHVLSELGGAVDVQWASGNRFLLTEFEEFFTTPVTIIQRSKDGRVRAEHHQVAPSIVNTWYGKGRQKKKPAGRTKGSGGKNRHDPLDINEIRRLEEVDHDD